MRQWIASALVQIMYCRLVGAKPLSNQCWNVDNLTFGNKLQWDFNRNQYIFIQENVFANVCSMVAILSRVRWVNLHDDLFGLNAVFWQHSMFIKVRKYLAPYFTVGDFRIQVILQVVYGCHVTPVTRGVLGYVSYQKGIKGILVIP